MPGLAETAELAVRISLKDNASAGLNKLQGNVKSLGSSLGQVGKGVGQVGTGIARAGVRIGAAVVTGLGAATKVAIDFEDAFAGVRKTVEASPAELDKLYGSLRNLATRIPIKFTDLAAIAQEAGALGVRTQDVAGFTDVVARLSAATVGLSTDAAAEAFGKLGNVLFTTKEKADGLIEEYNRMGSALVALGNAGASSEGDIIEVAKRFGAAGHAAGLSAAQILGLSSALASLGVEPEAAGGALSRLLNNLTTNLALGNDKAKGFAKVLGLTAQQAKKAFGRDALGTFEKFLQGLSKLNKFQQAKVLKAAGITNTRDINAIKLLSQQYTEVARQVDLSTKAYEENTALAEISAKRFATLKNSLITLKNLFFDSAVTLAEGFTPALGRAANKIRELISQPGTQASLKSIGEDIGSAIDNINWQSVIDGTKSLVGLFKGALSIALEIAKALDKLPGPLKEAALGFLTLNKLSGGLIGTGLGNIVGGLGQTAVRGLGSQLPGGVGKLFAQPVFVTNWPIGGLGGGGGPVPVGGGGGVLGTLARFTVLGFAGGALVDLAGVIGPELRKAVTGSTEPLAKDHTVAQLGPLQIGLFRSQAQIYREGVTKAAQQVEKLRETEQAGHSEAVRDMATQARATQDAIARARDATESSRIALATKLGETRNAMASGADRIVNAIQRNRPVVNVRVGFRTTTVVKVGSTLHAVTSGIEFTGIPH